MREDDSIGRYEITAELGRGSMGIVHRAHDPVVGRDLAVKRILLPHGFKSEEKQEFRELFLREAQAAGRLSHPGIVTVYDFNQGLDSEPPFIAMEFVEGPTLHELIRHEGALNPEWVLSIGDTLADALQSAHDSGVVHRDLKPANILVREADGTAKIADFGVARANLSEMTDAGTPYGSPAYMAPERLKGQPADARSDLFSLGVILFEALCGERPFGGGDFASTCHAILHEEPPPVGKFAPDLSSAFDGFFSRALAKNPDERFQTGAALRDALRSVACDPERSPDPGSAALRIEDEPLAPVAKRIDEAIRAGVEARARTATSTRRPSSDRSLILGGAAALLLVVVSGWWGFRPARDAAGSAAAERLPVAVQDESSVLAPLASFGTIFDASDSPEASDGIVPPASESPAATVPEPIRSTPVRGAVLPAEPAYLDLHIKSSIKTGTLELLVDSETVYAGELATESRRWTRLVKKATRKVRQDLETRIEIPAGLHTITARVLGADGETRFEESLDVDLGPTESRGLQIVAGRSFGRRLTMKLD